MFSVPLLLTAALLAGAEVTTRDATLGFECTDPPTQAHKVSSSPLIIYLQNFITVDERSHLKLVSEPKFRPSVVASHDGAPQRSDIRTSQSTDVHRDAVVRCIEQRALRFQGFDAREEQLEPLQLVKYGPGEHYDFHTDWLDSQYSTSFNGGNRMTSFFVYVHVPNDTTGGGTNFPLVTPPRDSRWCGLIECDEPYANGLTFRPVEGNAIFWENLAPSGAGDARTEHAGLPVTTGSKIGMNIWTRQAPVSDEVRRQDVPLDF
ncbi:2OG-Fe(II) oxygenase superfamily protein [Lasiosphaeris hirsuta]|uniref:2OG-Fe(II) oxygenase superfamily protein n=1 Tax=Lasiosphaeris hirsuta TaxID=260670 RepID=A0AA40B052_9PEZI|nr:2OG-Fe(II) oxygenase superfamily protein [Lasiosphaeris hirsuta]